MSASEEPGQPAAAGWSRNDKLGIWNGWLVSVGDGFLSSTLVLTGFAARLGASNAVIGLLPAIQGGGWMPPQILVAALIQARTHKLPVYRSAAGLRMLSYAAMVVLSATLWQTPALLPLFLLAMLVNALASGVSDLPFLEVCAKIISPSERAGFFGTRNLVGGLLAFGAGLLVRQILASGLRFPYNYTLIFGLATVFYSVGYWRVGRVTEPANPPQPPSDVRAGLRAIPGTLRADPHFRAFLGVRLLLAFASLADPFYVVSALRDLHMPPSMLGVFVMALSGAAPLSNLVWTRLAQRRGSRRIIRFSAACACLAPVLALALTHARTGPTCSCSWPAAWPRRASTWGTPTTC